MKVKEHDEHLVGKVILEGTLKLDAPLLLGDGAGNMTAARNKDIHVLRNAEGKAFIPGTSLVGVLRNLLESQSPELVKEIFGDLETMQSTVQAEDIVFEKSTPIFRDGVRIDDYKGSAMNGKKYDYEAIERGAEAALRLVFTLRAFHLLEGTDKLRDTVKNSIYFLRDRLAAGIHLGANTSKGMGRAHLISPILGHYDFHKNKDVLAWLSSDQPAAANASIQMSETGTMPLEAADTFSVSATFALCSSLLVRDYQTSSEGKQIAVMKRSMDVPVIPGSTIKGVLRHRAARILRELGHNQKLLDNLMGSAGDEDKHDKSMTGGRIKSRFIVEESYLEENPEQLNEALVTRNRIDRFTGGVMGNALLNTKPLYQKDSSVGTVKIRFAIRHATEAEAGLALFLLKDLWQGKLTLGGETSIGRGRLKGIRAEIQYKKDKFILEGNGKLIAGDLSVLEECAASLQRKEA